MHPPRQSKSPIFEEVGETWTVGAVNLVVFSLCFEGDDYKKGCQLFRGKKSVPPPPR